MMFQGESADDVNEYSALFNHLGIVFGGTLTDLDR